MAKSSDSAKANMPDGLEKKVATFLVSAALLEELGERLVSKPEVALAELIKNAYDADAKECTLYISTGEITISDSGHGMTESEFLKNWMEVSTQQKGLLRFSRSFGRAMAGSKGVGRFSARYLGSKVKLTSVADDLTLNARTKLVAEFDWEKISKSASISTIKIDYTVSKVSQTVPLGTELVISNLRENSKKISRSKIRTDILKLVDPIEGFEKPPFKRDKAQPAPESKDPGFAVKIVNMDADAKKSDDKDVPQSVAKGVLDAFIGRARIEVSVSGKVKLSIYWRGKSEPIEYKEFSLSDVAEGFTADAITAAENDEEKDERGLIAAVEKIPHLPLALKLSSPVFIDLRFFPNRKGTFTELAVRGPDARSWMKENSGIAIIDNGFALSEYADKSSDWLRLDDSAAKSERNWKSVITPWLYPMSPRDKNDPARNPALALPTTTNIVGKVHIATRKAPPEAVQQGGDDWLQPNMDRESLRSNGAFHLLWHLSRFGAEALAHFDRKIRLKEVERLHRQEEIMNRTALSKTIADVRSSREIAPSVKSQILGQLKSIESHIAESDKYNQAAKESVELMSMMGVMAGFMTHEFEKAMKALNDAVIAIEKLKHLSPTLKACADEVVQQEKSLASFLDYMSFFVNRARDPQPTKFKSFAQVELAVNTLRSIAKAHNVDISIDIPSSLQGPHIPVAAYNGIVINLVSNAIKALIQRTGDGPRTILISASNAGNRHVLVCSDNGIGIPEFLRKRIWDPLFTTTTKEDTNPLATGMGLGLSLVHRVSKNLGGKAELQDVASPGFVTSFRVTLPANN